MRTHGLQTIYHQFLPFMIAILIFTSSSCLDTSPGVSDNQSEVTSEITDTGEGPSADIGALPEKSNPLHVAVILDVESRQVALIPVSGGTLTATGPDGTKFTLTIPANALLSDQEIRMTPISSIDGLPFSGGFVAAVDLKPDGLVLFQPATLTIEFPQGILSSEFIGFSLKHEGEELFLYPMDVASTSVTVSLMHFSGYGGGSGTSSDSGIMSDFPPSSAEDKAMQAIASTGNKSGDDIPYDEWEIILREWYTTSVEPDLKTAITDDSVLESSITQFLRWAKEAALDGVSDRFTTEIENGKISVSKAINNAIDKVSKRCTSQSNPAEARRLMRIAKMTLLLGEWAGPGSSAQAERALNEVARCARFELQFDSTIQTISGCQSNFVSHVRATIQLKVEEGTSAFLEKQFKGEGSLEYLEFSPPSGCPEQEGMIMCPAQSTGKSGSTFTVVGATLFNLNYSEEADSQPPSISVIYDPGDPKETMIVQCPKADPVEVFGLMQEIGLGEVLMWRDGYKATHQSEMADLGGQSSYVAQDWDYSGGSLYASKSYQGKRGETEVGYEVIEDTTIKLIHKPGG